MIYIVILLIAVLVCFMFEDGSPLFIAALICLCLGMCTNNVEITTEGFTDSCKSTETTQSYTKPRFDRQQTVYVEANPNLVGNISNIQCKEGGTACVYTVDFGNNVTSLFVADQLKPFEEIKNESQNLSIPSSSDLMFDPNRANPYAR